MPKVQMCELCDEPTGRTTEDQLEVICEKGPNLIVCEDCYDEAISEERMDRGGQ